MRTLWLVAPLLLLCPLAQTAPAGLPPPLKDPPPSEFEQGMMVRFHMHENYGLVRTIEKRILKGNLKDATELASAIAQAPAEPALNSFATQAAEVRKRAQELSLATNLDQAARREAALAASCAGCHDAANVVPDVGVAPAAPPERDTIESRMARHAWAADRLWDGIMANDDGAWTAGLDVLAAPTPVWSKMSSAKQGIARKLQQTAETERRVKNTQLGKRTTAYGEMLVLCAGCHTDPHQQ
ncbi:MAG TPA: hypothetical protein VGM90_01425 [Kofleriaceae bacterium]